MEGHLVKLRAIEEEDYELFAKWIIPSKTSSLARGVNDFVTSKEVKADVESGNTRYAMVLTHDDRKIGFISWASQTYEGNYLLGGIIGDPELWDNGYGAEAGMLIIDYLFHYKNAHKLQFINGLYNARSVQFIIKTKVVIEGILRDHYFIDGEYQDAIISSILRDEYYEYPGTDKIDSIPKEEKRKARDELDAYLNKHWKDDFFSKLLQTR